jgi:hypothetical protein
VVDMWPFRRQPSNFDVLERLESLERRFKTIVADVDEYFQMVRRAENRIKKKQAEVESQPDQPTNGTEDLAVFPGTATPGPLMSPRQKQIQQQILRRRAGL